MTARLALIYDLIDRARHHFAALDQQQQADAVRRLAIARSAISRNSCSCSVAIVLSSFSASEENEMAKQYLAGANPKRQPCSRPCVIARTARYSPFLGNILQEDPQAQRLLGHRHLKTTTGKYLTHRKPKKVVPVR